MWMALYSTERPKQRRMDFMKDHMAKNEVTPDMMNNV